MGLDELVFSTGDRVTGWGRLHEAPDGVWFDPGGWRTGNEPPLPPNAVRLHGADPAAAAAGPHQGWATVTGVWSGDAIEVEHQSPARPDRPFSPVGTRPPCDPPAGGWPAGPEPSFDLGDLWDTGAAVSVAIFSPGADRTVVVVAAADQPAVERQLRPQLGERLCVVPSRWTKDQLDGARDVLQEHVREWGLGMFDRGCRADGQASVHVMLFRVLPSMAAWAAGLPAGLLEVEPVLAPARGQDAP